MDPHPRGWGRDWDQWSVFKLVLGCYQLRVPLTHVGTCSVLCSGSAVYRSPGTLIPYRDLTYQVSETSNLYYY